MNEDNLNNKTIMYFLVIMIVSFLSYYKNDVNLLSIQLPGYIGLGIHLFREWKKKKDL